MTLPSWRNVDMTSEEKAWIVKQWLDGRTQVDICNEIGYSAVVATNAIALFCEQWTETNVRSRWIYDGNRKAVAATALRNFTSAGLQPIRPYRSPLYRKTLEQYLSARAEHFWLLRAEGLTLREIGERVDGLSRGRVEQIVAKFSRRMQRAMRHTRWHFE